MYMSEHITVKEEDLLSNKMSKMHCSNKGIINSISTVAQLVT